MLDSKHGSGQSIDCAAQSMDPCFDMDCPLNPWTAQTEGCKAWIWASHGLTGTITIAVATRVEGTWLSRKQRGHIYHLLVIEKSLLNFVNC